MKYHKLTTPTQEKRKEANNMVLGNIKSKTITQEKAFNIFTGMGKLHGLNFNQFGSFHEYTDAKKEIENGAFFTPFEIAHKITEVLNPLGEILDPCCGSGMFANFVDDFTGIEIDPKSFEVANYCFPDANIINTNTQFWNSNGKKYDYILTNPPFNLKWGKITSQSFILRSSKVWLKNYGIFAAVVPETYLKDEMTYKQDIKFINQNFHWIGQVNLSKEAFNEVYNISFPTKVIFFQNCKGDDYSNSSYSWDSLDTRINKSNQDRRANLVSIAQSEVKENDYSFADSQREKNGGYSFQLKKLLFEIKTHKKDLLKAYDLIKRFQEQEKPHFVDRKEWEKTALTEGTVLARLRVIAGFKKKRTKQIPSKPADKAQLIPFSEVVPNEEVRNFVENYTFINKKGSFNLNDIQKTDVSKLLCKKYAILNAEQGTGKTPQAFAVCEYRKAKLNIVLAPAIAINSTWSEHLKLNNKTYKVIKKDADIDFNVDYWLIGYTALAINKRLAKALKRQLRRISNNVQLIVDESDELSNRSSKAYKSARIAFNKCKFKLLTTGTTTRNNVTELYPQLELLYNNSNNLIDECKKIYQEEDGKIIELTNKNYNKPFGGYNGLAQFKRCFSPSKTTVFGIKKHNQDLYNYDKLTKILEYTCIVRTFKEVVGDKYQIHHKRIISSFAEKQLHETIIKESHKVIYEHYKHTGNQKKESFLRILRELNLLIKACSMPQSFSQYKGVGSTKHSYILNMVKENDEKIIIGCLKKDAAKDYKNKIEKLGRKVFYIDGSVNFNKRKELIKDFEQTTNGIIVCTQQSLKSSINIPSCNIVIIESLGWNFPKISQFFFRAIRFNSVENTNVYFVTHANSIEDNLLGLIMAKEKINRSVKLDNKEDNEIFNEYGFDISILDSLLSKVYDKESKKMTIAWGKQAIVNSGEQIQLNF